MGECTGTQREKQSSAMPGERFPLPRVQDCYDCANLCLDMWNDSVDHAAQSSLLRMADAWLQLAFESDNHQRAEQSRNHDADRHPRRHQQNHEPRPSMSDIGRAVPE
jgi:hypothetical protein